MNNDRTVSAKDGPTPLVVTPYLVTNPQGFVLNLQHTLERLDKSIWSPARMQMWAVVLLNQTADLVATLKTLHVEGETYHGFNCPTDSLSVNESGLPYECEKGQWRCGRCKAILPSFHPR